MAEKITYVGQDALQYLVNKTKEYVSTNYVTKNEIGDINAILDNINGEAI